MSYNTFVKIAKEARQSRCETTVMALCEAYATMKCALYPVDVELLLEVYGGPPAGWEWDEYHAGLGGYTNLRRA
jgi:hypothetical protein